MSAFSGSDPMTPGWGWVESGATSRVAGNGGHHPVSPAADADAGSRERLVRPAAITPVIDAAHLERQRAFSTTTFGPGPRTKGVIAHIRKELVEVEARPDDVSEWIDVMILAADGALRAGHEPQAIIDAWLAKQTRNEARTWPDWRAASEDEPIEHVRTVPAGLTLHEVSLVENPPHPSWRVETVLP